MHITEIKNIPLIPVQNVQFLCKDILMAGCLSMLPCHLYSVICRLGLGQEIKSLAPMEIRSGLALVSDRKPNVLVSFQSLNLTSCLHRCTKHA